MDNNRNISAEKWRGKNALVVEDNEINAEIACIQLRSMGFSVDCVANGARAVEYFGASEAGHYAIILMDIMMPVMDGIEATRIIRKLDRTDAKGVPIIAVSANAFDADQEAAFANGVTSFLTKPYSKKKLQEVIDELLLT